MNISMRKINAIFILRLQLILKNFSLLMAPLMAIGYVIAFKNFFPSNLPSQSPNFKYGDYPKHNNGWNHVWLLSDC